MECRVASDRRPRGPRPKFSWRRARWRLQELSLKVIFALRGRHVAGHEVTCTAKGCVAEDALYFIAQYNRIVRLGRTVVAALGEITERKTRFAVVGVCF